MRMLFFRIPYWIQIIGTQDPEMVNKTQKKMNLNVYERTKSQIWYTQRNSYMLSLIRG